MDKKKKLRIAAFGCRHLPPKDGSAGEDKFAVELYPRIAELGHQVIVYTRIYSTNISVKGKYKNVCTIGLRTVRNSGLDTLLHSFLCTFHIILNNTADIVHIHNGGNSIWALMLRLFGKKVVVSQDGVDWKRDKWPWYGKLYLKLSSFITAYLPNEVVFDNVFAKDIFEKKFNKKYKMIEYGTNFIDHDIQSSILSKFGLQPYEYFLFIGRFIPDKGVHYLIEAFKKIKTNKKLILVGGSPNKDNYEFYLKHLAENNSQIIFTGFIYGDDVNKLIQNAYVYIQPSDVEGLSPVILQVMGIGTPLICSNIQENLYIVKDDAVHFKKGNASSLAEKLNYVQQHPLEINKKAKYGQSRIRKEYNWDSVTQKYIKIFQN